MQLPTLVSEQAYNSSSTVPEKMANWTKVPLTFVRRLSLRHFLPEQQRRLELELSTLSQYDSERSGVVRREVELDDVTMQEIEETGVFH